MIGDQEKKEILEQFQNDQHYRDNEKQIKENCIIQMQISKYDQKLKDNQYIISAGESINKQSVYYICGKFQPEKPQELSKLVYWLVAQITPQMTNKEYSLIYINTGLITHSNLSKFYSIFKELPVQYYQYLDRIYIIHGNMFIKSWFWFQNSVQIRTLKKKTVFINKLQTLGNFKFFGIQQLQTLPNYCQDSTSNQLKESVKMNSNGEIQQEKLQTISVIGINLDAYELNTKGIPLVLDIVISKFMQNPKNFEIEGLFRINSSCLVDQELDIILGNQQYQQISDFKDDIALANFIKRFFDKLAEPLFPFALYEHLSQQTNPTLESVIILIQQLPILNQQVLAFLITLLYKTQTYQDKNKMTSYNLAVIFGISIIRPKVFSQNDFINVKVVVAYTQYLIDHSQILFNNLSVENFLMDQQ